MRCTYFWRGNEVLEIPDQVFTKQAHERKLCGMFCVDGFYTDTISRYGTFIFNHGWSHVPLSEFPKEFRTHLLLLGIS